MSDPMDEVKARIDQAYEKFDRKRKTLVDAYHKAQTPKMRLQTLAKIVRQHGEYMSQNFLLSGWQTQAILMFADEMQTIARTMDAGDRQ